MVVKWYIDALHVLMFEVLLALAFGFTLANLVLLLKILKNIKKNGD